MDAESSREWKEVMFNKYQWDSAICAEKLQDEWNTIPA
jgi:hypothetical protein